MFANVRVATVTLAAGLMLATAAHAAVVVTDYNVSGPTTIANFDTSLGTLTQVDFVLSLPITPYPHYGGTPDAFTVHASGTHTISGLPVIGSLVLNHTETWSFPAGGPPSGLGYPLTATQTATQSVSGGGLVTFLAAGSFQASGSGMTFYSISGPGAANVFSPTPMSGRWGLQVRYTYDAPAVGVVPEPATWAMMLAGFGLAGGVVRSRRRVLIA